ncbi:BTAD domain-containing putative transcriptional regulator [Spirillospora sp. CA-294931]|uniref:AfsR/SARP family transcriptional regulator n=1 Tax=Spirillospora sp. CA-294931 TaxID=3240042 RepID=UPI003D8B4672
MGTAEELTRVRFSVLGPVRAARDGAELPIGGPQQRAMLAILLLGDGRPVQLDFLLGALWGDRPPSRAVGTLRTYASRLRRVLEDDRAHPEILVSAGDGYALRTPQNAFDLHVFERLTGEAGRVADPAGARRLLGDALGLWAGAPLPGIPGPWAERVRTRLQARRLDVLQRRLEIDLELGRHSEIIGELTALSDEHPLREPLHGLLMRALYRCGRQAEALEVYSQARRVLAGELGVDPSPELRELHARILRNDPSLSSRPGEEARPAPLPPPLPDFAGRAAKVDEIAGLLAAGAEGRRAPAVVAISGAAGVGKTALAVQVAHTTRDAFPDGRLYADLGGVGGSPKTQGEVLREFLRALGVLEAAVPEGEAAQAALYRSRLADRRVLIVLDNARDGAQIVPLLPGAPGCAVLVTSRATPAGVPGVKLFDLGVLEPYEAIALFTGIVGERRARAEPQAVVDAVELCGFLPLAVRILASRLAARPAATIASLVERLADGRQRLAELRIGDLAVEAAFRIGYDQLDERQARAFRLLAVPETGGASLGAAAALLGTTRDDAEDVLESLVDLGLLESPAPRSYRYHALVWLFARQMSEGTDGPGERRDALDRLLGFLLATQREVLRLVRPGLLPADRPRMDDPPFVSANEARAWLMRETTGMLTVVRQAALEGRASLGTMADLLMSMETLLEDGYRWVETEPAVRALLEEALRRGDARAEARARYLFGRVHGHTRDLPAAREATERAVELARATGDRALLGATLDLLGHVAFYQRRALEARGHIEAGLVIAEEVGDLAAQVERTSNLAYLRHETGDPAGAVAAAERGRELAQRIGHTAGEAYALYTLGLALRGLGRLDEAVARFDDGLALCWSVGLRAREAYMLYRIAETQLERGRPDDALVCAEKSLAIGREIGEDFHRARVLVVLGHALAALGRPDGEVSRCWRAALELFDGLGVPEAADVRGLLEAVRASRGP